MKKRILAAAGTLSLLAISTMAFANTSRDFNCENKIKVNIERIRGGLHLTTKIMLKGKLESVSAAWLKSSRNGDMFAIIFTPDKGTPDMSFSVVRALISSPAGNHSSIAYGDKYNNNGDQTLCTPTTNISDLEANTWWSLVRPQ